MNRLPSLLGTIVFLVVASPAWAQSPKASNENANDKLIATIKVLSETAAVAPKPASVVPPTSPTSTAKPKKSPTPTAETVVQRAAARADQRKQRLAAMKWQGHSNSRPKTRVDMTSW